jgi:hypothetical protein
LVEHKGALDCLEGEETVEKQQEKVVKKCVEKELEIIERGLIRVVLHSGNEKKEVNVIKRGDPGNQER